MTNSYQFEVVVNSVERLVFFPVGHHSSDFLLVGQVTENVSPLEILSVSSGFVAVQMSMAIRMVFKTTVTQGSNLKKHISSTVYLTTRTRLDIAFFVLSLYLLTLTLRGLFFRIILKARQTEGLNKPS